MTSKNWKWPGKTNFDVSLLQYLSDRNKTFTTLILHIGLYSDKVWRILNFLILHVLPDYYRQPLLTDIHWIPLESLDTNSGQRCVKYSAVNNSCHNETWNHDHVCQYLHNKRQSRFRNIIIIILIYQINQSDAFDISD
jgi:hypothetical protein